MATNQTSQTPQDKRDARAADGLQQSAVRQAAHLKSNPDLTHVVTTIKGNRLNVNDALAEVYRSKITRGLADEKAGRPNRYQIKSVEKIQGNKGPKE